MKPLVMAVVGAIWLGACAPSTPLPSISASGSTAADNGTMIKTLLELGPGHYTSTDGQAYEVEFAPTSDAAFDLYITIWQDDGRTLHVFCFDEGADGTVDECHLLDHSRNMEILLPDDQSAIFFGQALRRLTGASNIPTPSRAHNQDLSRT